MLTPSDLARRILQPYPYGRWPLDLWLIAARLMMAYTFFVSGRQKLQDWGTTVFLFEDEYKVPILPPEIAAYLATGFELGMPVLLVLGLCTRLAVLPLIGMSLVIQFVLGAANPAYNQIDHFYWLTLLLGLLVLGAGRVSLDMTLHSLLLRRSARKA